MDEKKVREALKLLTDLKYGYAYSEEVKGLLEQALAPEPRFYVGQPVLVADNDDADTWYRRLYVGCSDNGKYLIKTYEVDSESYWEHCKPDPDAVSLPNWIEHDGGAMPVAATDLVMVTTKYGITSGDKAEAYSWQDYDVDGDIVRYCIIPLPQFIDREE